MIPMPVLPLAIKTQAPNFAASRIDNYGERSWMNSLA